MQKILAERHYARPAGEGGGEMLPAGRSGVQRQGNGQMAFARITSRGNPNLRARGPLDWNLAPFGAPEPGCWNLLGSDFPG